MLMLRAHSRIATAAVLLCATMSLGCDAPEPEENVDLALRKSTKANPPPDPFTTFAVFIADGVIPPGVDPAGAGDLSFFTDVMGWSQAEIDAWRDEKVATTETRWGIPDPLNNPDLQFYMGTTSPAIHYHAVAFSDRKVPTEGWPVREGAANFLVVNPAGIDLGGDFAGIHVPAGTIVGGGGMYNVGVTDKHGELTGEEIVIDFDTQEPMWQNPSNHYAFGFGFFCELDSEDFGDGLAQGIITLIPQLDGSLKANARNVLTFSADSGL
jgi:hypothetical protein